MTVTFLESGHVDKETYKRVFPILKSQMRELQQKLREARMSLVVMFNGVRMSGWEDSIKHLTESLDPRGFVVHSTHALNEEEERHQWLWRFWVRLPAREKMTLFGYTWYTRALREKMTGAQSPAEWERTLEEICDTEEMLAQDQTLIVKFWLDLSKKELKKRLREAEENPAGFYTVKKEDWREYDQYDRYRETAHEMIAMTSARQAPWHVIPAADDRFRRMKIFEILTATIAAALEKGEIRAEERIPRRHAPVILGNLPMLAGVDLSQTISEKEYDDHKIALQVHLRKLQQTVIEQEKHAMVVVYEGWDAAGKGGSIRRLTATLDPQYYDVIPISKPTPEEKNHHYLWRFWKDIPKRSHMTIFDRSWYGRVLVERIEGFCTEMEWQRAYDEINAFEQQLTRANVLIVKFWLHVTQEEQLRRFQARDLDPHKRYKMNEEDWRNRDKWTAYEQAVNDMIARTSTADAPWTIIEGNCKRHARVRAMQAVIAALEKAVGKKKG
ncbi:polyphosphate:AMP phosphotransferase [Candidatus Sumerlaeota bacterium]|nr:polyphosphate:AMP phosphotransferase [Candidatus Sumerlaeota bacterium]